MKPSIYVAAPWTHRETAAHVAELLARRGYHVTHDWWAHEAGAEDTPELARLARLDLLAVLACDLFIVLNLEKSEGKSVEQGLVLSRHYRSGKVPRLIGVGPRGTNIFQNLPLWTWVDSIESLLALLE